jgi:hypothetical protein
MSRVRASKLFVTLIFFTAAVSYGQLVRSAVSVAGSDLNPCTPALPCRSIAVALGQTNAGGEVIVLDSAGYGAFTVSKSVSVEAAPGVYAGVTTPTGYGVAVNAGSSDTVVLRGLTVNGLGTADGGIGFGGPGARLYVENCVIQNFVNFGILTFYNIMVTDTTIRNCAIGISIDNAGAAVKGTIDHLSVIGASTAGIKSHRNANVTVSNSSVSSSGAGFLARFGILNIESCLSSNNTTGVLSDFGGVANISNMMTAGNVVGWLIDTANGASAIRSCGNNHTRGNTTDVTGTPASIVLQ